MGTAADIEFVVGENYENEKGLFTVVSIRRQEMVIRWESGEQITTDINLQRNIQARRRWEKFQKENVPKAAKRAGGAAGARPQFTGFQAADFKNSASGTRWRGRGQLGGVVTKKLPDGPFNFNSWAFANKPELHWRDLSQRQREGADQGARFLARVDGMSLFYGLSIVRPDDKVGTSQEWSVFSEWVAQAKSDELLHRLALEHELAIRERTTSALAVLAPESQGWRVDDKVYATVAEFIHQLPATGPLNLEITRRLEKIHVVARGKKVADEIAGIIEVLMPVYQAALEIIG